MLQALKHEVEEQAEKELDDKIWDLWVHKYEGDLSFGEYKQDFKERLEKRTRPKPKAVAPESMGRNLSIASKTLSKLRTSQKGGE